MELITKYPVLIDPTTEQKDKFRFTPDTKGMPGDLQTVQVGDLTIKGNTPVFEGDKQISQNDFLYLKEVQQNGEVLTPMDEYLYSERNISEGALGFGEFENWGDVFANADGDTTPSKKEQRRKARQEARAKANTTTPGNGEPSKEEQDAALKQGKFWNVLKGGWDNFTKSSSGQIILDSATNYVANKLGGTSNYGVSDTTPPTTTPDPKADGEPMSKTTKTILIVGGVALLGIIVYAFSKSSGK
jgi:hypothetical protein